MANEAVILRYYARKRMHAEYEYSNPRLRVVLGHCAVFRQASMLLLEEEEAAVNQSTEDCNTANNQNSFSADNDCCSDDGSVYSDEELEEFDETTWDMEVDETPASPDLMAVRDDIVLTEDEDEDDYIDQAAAYDQICCTAENDTDANLSRCTDAQDHNTSNKSNKRPQLLPTAFKVLHTLAAKTTALTSIPNLILDVTGDKEDEDEDDHESVTTVTTVAKTSPSPFSLSSSSQSSTSSTSTSDTFPNSTSNSSLSSSLNSSSNSSSISVSISDSTSSSTSNSTSSSTSNSRTRYSTPSSSSSDNLEKTIMRLAKAIYKILVTIHPKSPWLILSPLTLEQNGDIEAQRWLETALSNMAPDRDFVPTSCWNEMDPCGWIVCKAVK